MTLIVDSGCYALPCMSVYWIWASDENLSLYTHDSKCSSLSRGCNCNFSNSGIAGRIASLGDIVGRKWFSVLLLKFLNKCLLMVSQNCLLLFLVSVIVQWLVYVCILYVSGEVSAISIFILEKPGWIKKKKGSHYENTLIRFLAELDDWCHDTIPRLLPNALRPVSFPKPFLLTLQENKAIRSWKEFRTAALRKSKEL